jgi:hypothetical protein
MQRSGASEAIRRNRKPLGCINGKSQAFKPIGANGWLPLLFGPAIPAPESSVTIAFLKTRKSSGRFRCY